MEVGEFDNVAQNVALSWSGKNSAIASCHYCIDNLEIIQCVKDEDTAYHAPGVNKNSIGVEHAGYAAQTEMQWNDAYSKKLLELSSEHIAKLCLKYNIPVSFINAAGLINGNSGITTHAEVSKAFKKSDHTDPGKNFPMGDFLIMIESYMAIPND